MKIVSSEGQFQGINHNRAMEPAHQPVYEMVTRTRTRTRTIAAGLVVANLALSGLLSKADNYNGNNTPPADGGYRAEACESAKQYHYEHAGFNAPGNTGGGNSRADVNTDTNWFRFPVNFQVHMLSTNKIGATTLYKAQMDQLDVTNSNNGAIMGLDPSTNSTGATAVQTNPAGWFIESFFNLNLRQSLDGGHTYTPQPTHVVLTNHNPPVFAMAPLLPPLGGRYGGETNSKIFFCTNFSSPCCTNGIIITNVIHTGFSTNFPPPPRGSNAVHTFSSTVSFNISMDNGLSFSAASAPAVVTVSVAHRTNDLFDPDTGRTTMVLDTEMTQLDISGGTLPAGVKLRQSPAMPSDGITTILSNGPSSYMISSSFNIMPELSLDNGSTWIPTCICKRMKHIPPPDYPSTCLSNAPLGFWRLNELSGTTAFNSGSLGPTANGTDTSIVQGDPGANLTGMGANNFAYSFNTTAFVDINSSSLNLNTVTVAAWVRIPTGFLSAIVSRGTNSWRLYIDNGGHAVFQTGQGGAAASTAPVDDAQWHMLAGVYTSSTFIEQIFVDGVLAGPISSATVPGNPTIHTQIGAAPDGSQARFFGDIAQVAVFNQALTAAQIQTLRTAAGGPPSSPTPVLTISPGLGTSFDITCFFGTTVQRTYSLSSSPNWTTIGSNASPYILTVTPTTNAAFFRLVR
ncbi:MAG: hypothetical protein C5B50_24830 [Verrucomicrobia bacterium]|nr:MAG: hypothetical protein C5B50_24830 [Verrucomicrobiota bacterium]